MKAGTITNDTHVGLLCPDCGEELVIRKLLANWAKDLGKPIYCPKGHQFMVTKVE